MLLTSNRMVIAEGTEWFPFKDEQESLEQACDKFIFFVWFCLGNDKAIDASFLIPACVILVQNSGSRVIPLEIGRLRPFD